MGLSPMYVITCLLFIGIIAALLFYSIPKHKKEAYAEGYKKALVDSTHTVLNRGIEQGRNKVFAQQKRTADSMRIAKREADSLHNLYKVVRVIDTQNWRVYGFGAERVPIPDTTYVRVYTNRHPKKKIPA